MTPHAAPPSPAPVAPRPDIAAAMSIVRARASLEHFVERVGRDDHGNPLQLGAIHRVLCRFVEWCIEHGRHGTIMAMPGLGKTTINNLGATWSLGRNQFARIAMTGAVDVRSRSNVSLCRQIIASPAYRDVFPGVIPDDGREDGPDDPEMMGWTQARIYIRRGAAQSPDPSIGAYPLISRREGFRADLAFPDDPMGRMIAESPTERDKTLRALEASWLSRALARGGVAISSHNCWHVADAGHWLRARSDHAALDIFVEGPRCDALRVTVRGGPTRDDLLDGNGPPRTTRPGTVTANNADNTDARDKPVAERSRAALDQFHGQSGQSGHGGQAEQYGHGGLWSEVLPLPSTLSPEALVAREHAGPGEFRRLFRGIALEDGDRTFAARHNADRDETCASLAGLATNAAGLIVATPADLTRLAFFGGGDFCGGGRAGNALAFVARRANSPETFPVEIHHFGGGLVGFVSRLDDLWFNRGVRWRVLKLENNGVQQMLLDALVTLSGREWASTIQPYTTGRNKANPEHGLPGLAAELEATPPRMLWPARQARERTTQGEEFAGLEAEMDAMPRILPRGKTPDRPMALLFAWTAAGQWRSGPPVLQLAGGTPRVNF